MLEWLRVNEGPMSLALTGVLVIVTTVYVLLTKKLVNAAVTQAKLQSNPVIGIELGPIRISPVFGPDRRNLGVFLKLANVGNAPAIEVLVDAEIELRYSTVEGHRAIPARFEPGVIPFLRPSEEVGAPGAHGVDRIDTHAANCSFGDTCVAAFLDDCREITRLNVERIEVDATRPAYEGPLLRVWVYYRNNLGQYFRSTYEATVDVEEIPAPEESADVHQHYVPRPKFHAEPISREQVEAEIAARDTLRDLSGW